TQQSSVNLPVDRIDDALRKAPTRPLGSRAEERLRTLRLRAELDELRVVQVRPKHADLMRKLVKLIVRDARLQPTALDRDGPASVGLNILGRLVKLPLKPTQQIPLQPSEAAHKLREVSYLHPPSPLAAAAHTAPA